MAITTCYSCGLIYESNFGSNVGHCPFCSFMEAFNNHQLKVTAMLKDIEELIVAMQGLPVCPVCKKEVPTAAAFISTHYRCFANSKEMENRKNLEIQKGLKGGKTYCHKCEKYFNANGVHSHRAMHVRKKQTVTYTCSEGTYVFDYFSKKITWKGI